MSTDDYASYLIRLWRQRDGETPGWRGELESVQSGKLWPFQDLPALFQLLRTQTDSRGLRDKVTGDEG